MPLKAKLEQQLLAELSRRNTDLIAQWLINKPVSITFLVDFILANHEKLSPRAAWALEIVSMQIDEPAQKYLPRIIEALPTIVSSSTRRTLTKVLMLHSIPEQHEGIMLDFCISMLETPKEPVAVKANCMTIIFNILPKYPELKNEIFAIIEDQLPHNSVGFKSRYKVLKRRLK